ncbi:MAG: SAM-dependent methyltransferase [Bacteroidales bacterium]|nr:SAM-dependent methyltransferase [Bacteroidales bacterium]
MTNAAEAQLILFPVPIGADDIQYSLPEKNLQWLNSCHTFIVEELRSARRFLKKAGYQHVIDDTIFYLLNEHTTLEETIHYLDPIARGENVGLLSEAGLPCVADPGMLVTRQAQQRGFKILPLVGPSSLMMALMASGLNGQRFAFNGYLPVDKGERVKAIRQLEQRVLKEGQTQLFIEAPYRNNQMLEALSSTLSANTLICVAVDITMPSQQIITDTALSWKKRRSTIDLHKRNTVFLIGH